MKLVKIQSIPSPTCHPKTTKTRSRQSPLFTSSTPSWDSAPLRRHQGCWHLESGILLSIALSPQDWVILTQRQESQSQAFSLLQVVNTKILCNGRQPRHRELFAKRTTNRRKRQNAENREQSEALKEEVTTPTQDPQDPRDYEACKRDIFLWTQCPTLNET